MKKELIILAFSIDIGGMTKQQVDETMQEYVAIVNESFNDDELKKHYIIKQFFLPSDKTKIECIYPKSNNIINTDIDIDIDIEHQIKEVETKILKYKDPKLWKEWTTLMRWAKLRNLDDIEKI